VSGPGEVGLPAPASGPGEVGYPAPVPPRGEAGLPAAVITCSDSAAAGQSVDRSGPLAGELLAALGHTLVGPVLIVPDEATRIEAAVRSALGDGARVVVLTGGTGAGPRDIAPEVLRGMGLRELPGIGEAIRAASRARVPAADLSRALGGVLSGAALVALPGSPGGVRDGLAAVGGLLGHAAAVAQGGGHGRGPGRPADRGLVRPDPIREAEVAAEVARPDAGAVVTFAGRVRDHDRGRQVRALGYEAHPDGDRVLAEVLAEARSRPGVLAAAARHRVGELAVGDLAFVAAVSAAHRGEAFAACAWLVDEVKVRLPIWKHQRFADGGDEWVGCP